MDHDVGVLDHMMPMPDGRMAPIAYHRACHRAKLERTFSGGENPEVFSIAHGGEDADIFPMGAPKDPYWDLEQARTVYKHDGKTKRVFPRGVPEMNRGPISINDLLHRDPSREDY